MTEAERFVDETAKWPTPDRIVWCDDRLHPPQPVEGAAERALAEREAADAEVARDARGLVARQRDGTPAVDALIAAPLIRQLDALTLHDGALDEEGIRRLPAAKLPHVKMTLKVWD